MRPIENESVIVPGLFLGMKPVSYLGYSLIVNCEYEVDPRPLVNYKGLFMHCPMKDEDWFRISESFINTTVQAVVEHYRMQGRTLIHCTAGLNRSAVVMAMVLVELGLSRAEAVRMIRQQRDEFCLCNRAFERWVLDEPLPTAETSTFREGTNGPSEGEKG